MPTPRRTHERLIALALGVTLTLNFPLLQVFSDTTLTFGIPLLYLYLFVVWIVAIALTGAVLEGKKAQQDSADSADERGESDSGGE